MALVPNLLNPRTRLKYYFKSIVFAACDGLNPFKLHHISSSLCSLKAHRRTRTCVLIAGGPSFTPAASKFLQSLQPHIDIFTINRFFNNPFSSSLISSYHLVSDPDLILDPSNRETLSRLKSFLLVNSTNLIVPYNTIFRQEFPQAAFFNDVENLLSNNLSPLYPRGYPSNSAFKALAVAIFLGYPRIYVFGLDYDMPHSLSVSTNNELIFDLKHNYGSKTVSYSHLYDSFGHALHSWSLDFHHLKKFRSSHIYNVSPNSLVDCFPKLSLDEFITHF